MTWKHFKELMELNGVPEDAIIKATDPEEGGMHAVTGITYGTNPDETYTVELFTDEP